jgi:hypothetical protein
MTSPILLENQCQRWISRTNSINKLLHLSIINLHAQCGSAQRNTRKLDPPTKHVYHIACRCYNVTVSNVIVEVRDCCG